MVSVEELFANEAAVAATAATVEAMEATDAVVAPEDTTCGADAVVIAPNKTFASQDVTGVGRICDTISGSVTVTTGC